jgi:hypothetical protein
MALVNIDGLFKTGEEVPVSGGYYFVESKNADCELSSEQAEAPLSKGERFLPHRQCKGAEI